MADAFPTRWRYCCASQKLLSMNTNVEIKVQLLPDLNICDVCHSVLSQHISKRGKENTEVFLLTISNEFPKLKFAHHWRQGKG